MVEVGQQLLLIQHTVILVVPLMLPVFVLFVLTPTGRLVPVLIPSSVSIMRTVQYTLVMLSSAPYYSVSGRARQLCAVYIILCLCLHVYVHTYVGMYALCPVLLACSCASAVDKQHCCLSFSLAVELPICLCTPLSSGGVLSEQTNCFCASVKASHSTQKPTSWLG